MGTDTLPNIAELLQPIAGDSAVGLSLRENAETDALYRQLKDARARARAIERRRGEHDPEYMETQPDWDPILEAVPRLLRDSTKDLEIAAWLTEAMVRRSGFSGLRDGLKLLRELVERFWDGLYPIPDEDGIAVRVAPVVGLSGEDADGTLIQPLAMVPITGPRAGEAYGEANFREACDLEKLDEVAHQRRIASGAVTLDKMQQSASDTPAEFYRELLATIGSCQEECRGLEQAIARRYQEYDASVFPPTLTNLNRQLERAVHAARSMAGNRLSGAPAAELPPVINVPGATPAAEAPAVAVMTREIAFEQLAQVAEFFRRTEPQSIVSYALEQVVRWGRMPLPDLLAEFVPDQASRTHFGWLGIVPKGEESSSKSA